MQISSAFKTIFAAGIALLIISCSNNSKKKVQVQEVTLQDIKQEEREVEPPPPPPLPKDSTIPSIKIKAGEKKCFVNEGLKYKTTVTLGFNDSEAIGVVSSEEIESGKKRSTAFKGTRKSDEFTVEFIEGKPPVVGDASEWTNKTWTLKKQGSKETLHIIFKAKSYETNKWEDTDYEFVMADCK